MPPFPLGRSAFSLGKLDNRLNARSDDRHRLCGLGFGRLLRRFRPRRDVRRQDRRAENRRDTKSSSLTSAGLWRLLSRPVALASQRGVLRRHLWMCGRCRRPWSLSPSGGVSRARSQAHQIRSGDARGHRSAIGRRRWPNQDSTMQASGDQLLD